MNLGLRPIVSIKKIIAGGGALIDGTTATIPLANAVAGTAWVDAADDLVPQACTIKSFYLSVFVYSTADGTAAPIIDWYISKNPSDSLTMPAPTAVAGNENRRFVFHQERGLAANTSGTPMVFKGVIKVPRGFQRMGRDDNWAVRLVINGEAGFFCLQAIYKFYQ